MENNNKTQAELYREERKERLAKAAAKNAKKSPKSIKASKTAKKVIAIVLAVVIAFGAVAGVLNFFDVPQKAVKISIDGIKSKISLAEINYFYFQTWTQSYSNSMQYEQYGISTGFDYTQTPDKQEYTEEHVQYAGVAMEDLGDIENPTWEDVFTYSAVTQLVYIKYGAEKAKEIGLELTEEEKEIEAQFDEIRETAKSNDYSLNRWLRLQLGYGVTEKMIRNITSDSYLAEKYYEKVTEDAKNAVTDEMINEEYAANKDQYDIVDIRVYEFTGEMEEHTHEDTEEHDKMHEEAVAGAKTEAENFFKDITDEESFIAAAKSAILTADNDSTLDPDASTILDDTSYSEITSNYDEAVSKWVYDDARKAGDFAIVEGTSDAYAVFMVSTPVKDTSIYSSDVRHILVQFPEKNTDGSATSVTNEDGTTSTNITDETKAETKAKAQAILDEYLKNPTEDNFAALAKEKTEDTASAETGGLYEGVMNDGQYVEAFTNWAIADGRKAGDTGIVETEYGYHIMYFVKSNGENWSTAIVTKISGTEIEETVANVIDAAAKDIDIDSFFINWTLKRENEHIATILVNNLGSHAGHDH